MKLISFVAISFLAITVSAQTPPSASTEDMQQHQSTATQSAQQHQSTATRIPQQHDQDGFQAELEELEEAFKKIEASILDLNGCISAMEKEMSELELEISRLKKELYGMGIGNPEKQELTNIYFDKSQSWGTIYLSLETKQTELKNALDEHGAMKARLEELKKSRK
ncbi:hypothetical protein BASA50_001119 [Batrachochytrium salamandrivorans]|uniref:Uncharacterized protein n=1 Tax=Batrachochytrium salamandrivorans TaxID=1357716 RepID=A0ABQ8EUN3_9FUNG|nr:hypothetical protein BASA60_006092 [Batrachochytrium salamandrivorans]KAH6580872.1 hypothetical protein BASA61_009327 [Batrachochytrium salamandrivorans]KAH6585510.1 hypothetical protein BASA50_001119 [Batrachochytrium salamandrivorans]